MIVYRLEDDEGHGPFWGGQDIVGYLVAHNEPESMLKSAGLNRKSFNRLCNLGWKFAWSTQEMANKFFSTDVGRTRAAELGFLFRKKSVSKYIIFEDGQVMFKEEDSSMKSTAVHQWTKEIPTEDGVQTCLLLEEPK